LLIVLEGVDCTGKTTLAEELRRRTQGTVIHTGQPTSEPIVEYETPLRDYDPRRRETVILDRWHLGEHVWPTIFQRDTDLDLAVARHLELFMRSRGAAYVYCERDPEHLRRDLVKFDEPLHPERLDEAMDLFEDAIAFGCRAVSRWNYQLGPATLPLRFIERADALREDVISAWTAIGYDWIGTPDPEVLLVGDRWGGQPTPLDALSPWVPFVPSNNGCGHYLMRALPEEWWHRCAIVNALTHDVTDWVPRDLERAWKALRCPKVIALGRAAITALDKTRIPHNQVPHPQWWRRFAYHDLDGYTSALRSAAGP
jgi:hypothetical protein